MAAGLSLCFFCIHAAMYVVFNRCGVTPMARFNIFSMLFYLVSIPLAWAGRYRAYIVAVYLEIVAHMVCAVVNVGWDAGFQISLIGISIFAFFAEYLSRALSSPYVPALGLCIMGMCGYLFSYEYVQYHTPPYLLPAEMEFWLQVTWGIIVFVITVAFLQIFVIITFESEKLMSVQLAHDELTGLPNRYYMDDYLSALTAEKGLSGYWVAMVDIDDFKRINDTYGHNCGDYVLCELSRIVREETRGWELCRWGGEEFLLVGEAGSSFEEQMERLTHLCQTVGEHNFWYEEQRIRLTVTVGAALWGTPASLHEWINAADKNLYEGKRVGKNRVVWTRM